MDGLRVEGVNFNGCNLLKCSANLRSNFMISDTSCSQTPPDGQPWPRKAVDFYSLLVKLAPVFRGTRMASGKVGRSPRPERWCSRRNPSKITLNHDCIWLLIWSKLHRHHIIYIYVCIHTSFLLLDMWVQSCFFQSPCACFFLPEAETAASGVAILSINSVSYGKLVAGDVVISYALSTYRKMVPVGYFQK